MTPPPARGADPVRFRSTRAGPDATSVALEEAVRAGLAPDGGLYLPDRVPELPDDWSDAPTFAESAVRTLAPWWGDGAADVAPLLRDALDLRVPLRAIGEDRYLLELFHGPTAAFKDVGARVMARVLRRATERSGERATVLVATSGDTGSAVADGFAGIPNLRVVLLYPRGRVSEVQERQLTVRRRGVRAFAVDGDFDACQRLVKGAFRDPRLAGIGRTSANSINVGRLIPQAAPYVWAVAQARRDHGLADPLRIVVPSGNLGNLVAGLLAYDAGLPVARFLAAHNANRTFPEALAGRAERDATRPTVATHSNAMDVGAPSNAERLWARWGDAVRDRLDAISVDDDATLARMRRERERHGTFVCPHTAVGLEALDRWRTQGAVGPAVVLATAHPAKFPDAVLRATGERPPSSPELDALLDRPTSVTALPADPDALADALLDDAG